MYSFNTSKSNVYRNLDVSKDLTIIAVVLLLAVVAISVLMSRFNVKSANVTVSISSTDAREYTANWIAVEGTGYAYGDNNWISSDTTLVANSSGDDKEITMPAGDLTLTESAVRTANLYSIEYDLNGGIAPQGLSNPETYTAEDSNIMLNNPQDGAKVGYKFAGWTGGVVNSSNELDSSLPFGRTGQTTEPTRLLILATGSLGNRKYIANWVEDDFNYVVKYHYEDDEEYTSAPISAKYNEVISAFEERGRAGYKLREQPTPITISNDETQNVLNVYYVKEPYTVTTDIFTLENSTRQGNVFQEWIGVTRDIVNYAEGYILSSADKIMTFVVNQVNVN